MAGLFSAAIFIIFSTKIPQLFTQDADLLSEVAKTLPYYILYQFFDYMQGGSQGIIRGMGKQKAASITNIFSCYLVALPLGSYCAFNLGYGIQGLWMGLVINVIIQSSIFQLVIFTSNWGLIAKRAAGNIKESSCSVDTTVSSVDMGPQ